LPKSRPRRESRWPHENGHHRRPCQRRGNAVYDGGSAAQRPVPSISSASLIIPCQGREGRKCDQRGLADAPHRQSSEDETVRNQGDGEVSHTMGVSACHCSNTANGRQEATARQGRINQGSQADAMMRQELKTGARLQSTCPTERRSVC